MEQSHPQVIELVTNLDDVSGELIGATVEQLLADGALDVWTTPIAMKKNRPGVMLSVLCKVTHQAALTRRIIEMTGTFGVRYRTWDRIVLQRQSLTLETAHGPIEFKIGSLDDQPLVAAPEIESVRRAAAKSGAPLRQVLEAARAAGHEWLAEHGSSPGSVLA